MPKKPSENEQDWIHREEMERLRKIREREAAETAEAEKARLKELHWMRCPKCGMEMSEIDYRGVQVDACFSCGGMFFDQGEVEKMADEDGKDSGFFGRMSSALFGKS